MSEGRGHTSCIDVGGSLEGVHEHLNATSALTVRLYADPASSACWCGCGETTRVGRQFVQGHDKAAEGALLALRYEGNIVNLLKEHGFSPSHSVRQAAVDAGAWVDCPHGSCRFNGSESNVRKHVAENHGKEEEK